MTAATDYRHPFAGGVSHADNCTRGLMCPRCGSLEKFAIVSTCVAVVTDAGVESAADFEWADDAAIRCDGCGRGGTVAEFTLPAPTWEQAIYEVALLIAPSPEHEHPARLVVFKDGSWAVEEVATVPTVVVSGDAATVEEAKDAAIAAWRAIPDYQWTTVPRDKRRD